MTGRWERRELTWHSLQLLRESVHDDVVLHYVAHVVQVVLVEHDQGLGAGVPHLAAQRERLCYNPRKRKHHSNPNPSTAFPSDRAEQSQTVNPAGRTSGEKKILGNAFPHFLRLNVDLNVDSNILAQDRPRYPAKSDKGSTCIRRKALYLMLQMWSQAPKPTKESNYVETQASFLGLLCPSVLLS